MENLLIGFLVFIVIVAISLKVKKWRKKSIQLFEIKKYSYIQGYEYCNNSYGKQVARFKVDEKGNVLEMDMVKISPKELLNNLPEKYSKVIEEASRMNPYLNISQNPSNPGLEHCHDSNGKQVARFKLNKKGKVLKMDFLGIEPRELLKSIPEKYREVVGRAASRSIYFAISRYSYIQGYEYCHDVYGNQVARFKVDKKGQIIGVDLLNENPKKIMEGLTKKYSKILRKVG